MWQLRALTIKWTSAPSPRSSAATAGFTTLTIHSTDPVFATTSTSAPCGTSRATRPAITFLAGLGADDLLNAAVPAEVDQTLRKLRSRSSSQISFPRCAGEVAWNGNFRTFCIN